MIRRGLQPQSGGFWAAWRLGLGACTGDFIWALGVAAGAGALLSSPRLHLALGVISFLLLLCLAFNFGRGAWRTAQDNVGATSIQDSARRSSISRGYFLGLILALTSPWNIGFWFAVVGGQGAARERTTWVNSLTLAAAVVAGAIAWTLVLCTALKLGARIFARPAWQVGTQTVSALVMLLFAARLVWLWR